MNKRKIIGTIVGALIWACCVVFFTYAYYNWESENTIVSLTIQDSSTSCILGPNVEVENIGPVLNYQDGVKAEFEVENISDTNSTTGVTLDITSISETLLVDSFKYKLVQDVEGSTNYDYENPVTEGDFSDFAVGSNVIKSDVMVAAGEKYSFLFVVYIDGSMYNDINMQVNSMNANLSLGGCSESVQGEAIYQVAYNCNGGTGEMENSTHVYGVEKNLTSNSCAKVGHEFAGWATSQEGEVVYTNGQAVTNLTDVHRETVTLYAKWSANIYNVSFVGNKFSTVNQTVNGVDVDYDQTTSTLTLDGTQSESIPLMNWENQTFVEGEQYQFKVEYISGSYNCTSNATFATEIRNSSDSRLGLAHFLLPTTGSATATIDVTADMASNGKILFTQVWLDEANTMTFSEYKVKITLTKVENTEVVYDGTYETLPSNPTRYGYTFLGWYTSETGGSKIETTSEPEVYEDHTIYARWSPKSSKVLLVGNGGTISNGKTMNNLIKNGSFENGATDWTLSNAQVTTEQAYEGSHSTKLLGNSTAMTRQNLPYTAPTFNHYYYGRTMFLSSSNFSASDGRFEWYYADATGARIVYFDKRNVATTSWKLLSSVKILNSTSSYLDKSWYFRNFTVAATSDSYVDGNMVIDLTETFGSGSEMTDTTLLDTIPYFESTMSLKLEDVTYASSYGELPTPTRSGYNFLGWYTSETGGTKVTSSTKVNVDSDHTLYAKWGNITYTMTYDYSENYSYANAQYMDTGYTINWNEDFTIEETIKITTLGLRYLIIGNYTGSDDKALNLEINADNQLRIYTLSGQVSVTTGTIYANENINVIFNWDADTKSYNVSANGTNTNITYNGTINTSGTSNKTLRVGAVDHRGTSETFNAITVSSLKISNPYVYGDTLTSVPSITKEGYSLTGWYTSSTGGTQVSSGASLSVVGPYKIYARVTANTYTVTLNNQSATSAGSTSVTATYGSAMPAITKPARAYTVTYNTNGGTVNTNSATATYTFNGYYTSTGGGGTQYYTAAGASAKNWDKTAATTLYAKWTSASVTLPAPVRSNYAFAAWYTKASGGTKVANSGASYTPTANTTLYAQWVSVSIAAKKKTAATAVSSGSWSSEGLNFTFTASGQTTGATIQYCKDTNNTCTPSTTATSGTAVTSYNTTTGTYYIRYRVKGASGGYSTVKSYTAKVDTTTPTITMTTSRHDINDTANVYSTEYGSSGGTTTCVNTSYNNNAVTTYASINMLGTHAIKCTATSNAGLTATKTVNYEIVGTFNASNGLGVTGGNGYVSGTSIVLDQNAVQYGPYRWALAGCYYVWYFGSNLHVYPEGYYAYNTTGSVGGAHFTLYSLNYLSDQANYYLSIPNTTDRLELLRSNGTTTNVTVDYIHIYPVAWSYCA